MSGHSKWSQIKRTKGANDTKRGAVFAKHSKKISIAAREGGSGDPNHNFKLRLAIEKAKEISMPSDNIERAIKKGMGLSGGQIIETVIYEGYGPAGSAFIVEAATDNRNRTVSSIKHIFKEHGGSLGAEGSVAWQFTDKGQILISSTSKNVEALELAAIEAGAEDVVAQPEGLIVYTVPSKLEEVKAKLLDAKIIPELTEIIKLSSQPADLNEAEFVSVTELINALEDDEDVTAVHTNIK